MKRILSLILCIMVILTVFQSCAQLGKPIMTTKLLLAGAKCLRELNYEQAAVEFSALIDLDPKEPRGYIGLAEAYLGLNQKDKAVDILRKGLEQLPYNQSISTMLGSINVKLITTAYSFSFADYDEYVYTGIPSVPDYTINRGLSNVYNVMQFLPDNRDWDTSFGYWHSTDELSPEAVMLIEQNGFAVSDRYSHREFFDTYITNMYGYVPNFITTDSATHTFHLMFDYILKDLEENKLYYNLIALSDGMVEASYTQYKQLIGSSFENAALRNVAFFSVGSKLLNSEFNIPLEAIQITQQELSLINNQAGISPSPVINLGADMDGLNALQVDYSQFIPRSHYTQSEELKSYFKAMMWYGQSTFRSSIDDEVRSALLQTSSLMKPELSKMWAGIFESTSFFTGDCDDITYYQYAEVLKDVYDRNIASLDQISNEKLFSESIDLVRSMQPPQIVSIPVYYTQDLEAAITGYRFMGQRFTIDAYIFQNLIDRAVKGRMLPKSLDIPAAFGSSIALSMLNEDATAYPEYSGQMEKMREEISGIPADKWSSNLYWSWIYMLRPFMDGTDGAGYPMFMRNPAWSMKELNSFQGSWTELKHDTLLYSKSSMGGRGAGGEPPEPPDDRGYVEPNPVVFGRLAALVKQTKTGLQNRDILTAETKEILDELYSLSVQLTQIAEKELSNLPLSSDDYELIRTYGDRLKDIWKTAKKYELAQVKKDLTWIDESMLIEAYLTLHPCGIVADVSTDPNGFVLEEATGFAKTIFVVFLRDGVPVLASGTVYSQYEFIVPIDDRITDEQWHERMNTNEIPELEQWKHSFMCDIGQILPYISL